MLEDEECDPACVLGLPEEQVESKLDEFLFSIGRPDERVEVDKYAKEKGRNLVRNRTFAVDARWKYKTRFHMPRLDRALLADVGNLQMQALIQRIEKYVDDRDFTINQIMGVAIAACTLAARVLSLRKKESRKKRRGLTRSRHRRSLRLIPVVYRDRRLARPVCALRDGVPPQRRQVEQLAGGHLDAQRLQLGGAPLVLEVDGGPYLLRGGLVELRPQHAPPGRGRRAIGRCGLGGALAVRCGRVRPATQRAPLLRRQLRAHS